MSTSENSYPPVAFTFQLSFGSEEDNKNSFQEVSGIDMEVNTEEVVSGGENRFKYRLPGMTKYNNLVLKRGLILKDSTLFQWIQDALESGASSPVTTKTITVSLIDSTGTVLMSWNFINAYFVQLEVSEFNAVDSEVAVERLELAYSYFEKH